MKCRSPGRHFLLLIPLLWMAYGCAPVMLHSNESPLPGSTYLLHLPGIAGDTVFDRLWLNALQKGGAADEVQLYDWTCQDGWIDALEAHARNHEEARKVARLIASRFHANPRGKLIITAESGGTGIAVWALEHLPDGVKVDDVVLVAPALSADYNLSAALWHVKGKLYYFSSPGDWFVLGFGTQVFGTMDGIKSQAAGYVGFRQPPEADPAQYQKLVRMDYDPAWIQWGDWGNHTGGMSQSFALNVVAPLLVRDLHSSAEPPFRAAGKSHKTQTLGASATQRP